MPIAYEFRNGILVIRQTGVTETDEIFRAVGEALRHEDLKPGTCMLWDGRAAENVRSTSEIREGLARLETITDMLGDRIAILATRDLNYGMGQLTARYAAPQKEVRIFESEDAAIAWLSAE